MKVLAKFVLLFFLAGNSFCQSKKEYHEDYLIPDSYVGWVRAMHKVENAPPLPVEEGRTIYKFDESGVIKTSNDLPAGSIYANFYYYSNGNRTKLTNSAGKEGMIYSEKVINITILDFFVGTEKQYGLWYESNCGKERDVFDYLPQNIKQCLEDYEKNKRPSA
jgi:hypothetical protein